MAAVENAKLPANLHARPLAQLQTKSVRNKTAGSRWGRKYSAPIFVILQKDSK